MSVFVDTNVLLRSVQPTHPSHGAAVRSVARLIREGESLVVTPQIIAEFWNVATRPTDKNGLGFSPDTVTAEVAKIEEFCSIVAESIDVYTEWKRLIAMHEVRGVHAHDARLVAAMNVYGIRRILTFNGDDFGRYRIDVVAPS